MSKFDMPRGFGKWLFFGLLLNAIVFIGAVAIVAFAAKWALAS